MTEQNGGVHPHPAEKGRIQFCFWKMYLTPDHSGSDKNIQTYKISLPPISRTIIVMLIYNQANISNVTAID